MPAPNENKAPRVSPWLVKFFARYGDAYLRRQFHSIRLLQSGAPQRVEDVPLVAYLNHPSWWDPLMCLYLARRFFGERDSYGPIDQVALGRYRIFSRLGFFPVEHSVAGALRYLRTTDRLLASAKNAIWITPQGHFADARERPPRFERGLSHLAGRVRRAAFMPVALEYVFWEERLPEVLVSFGRPVVIDSNHRLSFDETTLLFETALTSEQDQLAAAAQRRDPREWTTLMSGRAGVGGVYQMWNRARARLRGERYHPAHSNL